MPRARRKVETPEKPSRAESVPGPEPEKAAKRERKDPYEKMSYAEAYQAFDEADIARKKAETEVQELRSRTLNGSASDAARKKLEHAMARHEELEDRTEEMRLVASRKFNKEELPAAFEQMSDDEAFEAFLKAEDEFREAEKHLRDVKKEVFKKLKGSPSKEQSAELREAEQARYRAKEQMEEIMEIAKHKNEVAHLKIAEEREEPQVEIKELEGAEAAEVGLTGIDHQIAEMEVAIDDLREAGGSDVELQEKVQELADMKEQRAELETEMRESEGKEYAGELAKELEAAKKDEHLAGSAEEFEVLSKQANKIEKRIKKMTGHEASQIDLNPSLAGGTMKRLGNRLKGFFTKLAGGEPEPHADDLMSEWRAMNKRLEELSNIIQPRPGIEHKLRAEGKRRIVDVEETAKSAVGREDEKERDAEYMNEATRLLDNVKHELREIELYDDLALFLEHAEDHAKNIESFDDKLSLLESHANSLEGYDELVSDANGVLETLRRRFKAKRAEFSEEARGAGKGKRVMSRIPGRKFGPSEPASTYGTEAARVRHQKIELVEPPGPKTELHAGPDAYREEIAAYRSEKAQEIKVAMDEYPPASQLWEKMNGVFEEHMTPEEYDELSKILGTRDLATAYVLDVAFAKLDNNKAARERVAKVNKILLIPEDAHIESDERFDVEAKAPEEKRLLKKKHKKSGSKKGKAA